MTIVPVMKIRRADGRTLTINQSDFDPETMTLFEGEEAPAHGPAADHAAAAPAVDLAAVREAVERAEKAEAALKEETAARQAAEKAKVDAEAKLEEVVSERDVAREEAKAAQAAAAEAKKQLEAVKRIPTDPAERREAIKGAIGKLDRDNPEHFTKGGKPQVEAIEAILGYQITAAERDEAWEPPAGG